MSVEVKVSDRSRSLISVEVKVVSVEGKVVDPCLLRSRLLIRVC